MNLKEKLAAATALQEFIHRFSGVVKTTDDEFAAITKLIDQEFPATEETNGKPDGKALLAQMQSLLDSLTAELVAVSELDV